MRGWTLRRRLLLILAIALMPIALVSVGQGLMRAVNDANDVRERLIQSARESASGDQNLFSAADQILRAVGNIADVRNMTAGCDTMLADALIGVRYFTGLSRIDASGRVACSATPRAKGILVADRNFFHEVQTTANMVVSDRLVSRASGEPVIGMLLAIRKPGGRFDGAVSVSLNVSWLDYMLRANSLPAGAVDLVFDRTGQIIASNNMGVARAIAPAALARGPGDGAERSATGPDRSTWQFATASLIGNSIFVAYGMRESRLFGRTYLQVGIDFLLPIAMILLAGGAIWFATDRQVTRWLVYLSHIAAAYRGGHYTIRPDLADAPHEFRQFGDALSDMAGSIQDRDHRLRDAVQQKTLMIKEIHHRVKNNLQIMMSLLSIQAAQVRDPNARDALMQVQMRINALALVHRTLNQLKEQSTLDVRQLMEELCHQVAQAMRKSEHLEISVDVPSREISGTAAMALALFTVEALTNVFKYAHSPGAKGAIRVHLEPAGRGRLRLAIEDDGVGFVVEEGAKSVGGHLMKTFGLQLGGVLQVCSEPGRGTIVELVFPDPDLNTPALPEAATTA